MGRIIYRAAYSPIKHVALTASHFRSRYTRGWKTDRVAMPEDYSHRTPNDIRYAFDMRYSDFGVGGYYPVRTNSRGHLFLADAYAGYGWGRTATEATIDFWKAYLQPGIHIRFTPNFELSNSYRFSMMRFPAVAMRGQLPDYILGYRGLERLQGRSVFFVEPSLTAKVGYRYIKFFSQFTLNHSLSGGVPNYKGSNVWLGIQLEIYNLWKALR